MPGRWRWQRDMHPARKLLSLLFLILMGTELTQNKRENKAEKMGGPESERKTTGEKTLNELPLFCLEARAGSLALPRTCSPNPNPAVGLRCPAYPQSPSPGAAQTISQSLLERFCMASRRGFLGPRKAWWRVVVVHCCRTDAFIHVHTHKCTHRGADTCREEPTRS
ncbi:LOW QUALITY PROTEIN: OLFM1 isoform 11 [Pan troglodytes]|uniref:OLFM1 isoform 11 n=1 Tax=Pan troglodytes TaxID=9598 RepID=A0A2J8NA76_PANTR|nr:LOW QUALITY PROTEIN: OLFM1 isoform 11 [Pan troglodytes]